MTRFLKIVTKIMLLNMALYDVGRATDLPPANITEIKLLGQGITNDGRLILAVDLSVNPPSPWPSYMRGIPRTIIYTSGSSKVVMTGASDQIVQQLQAKDKVPIIVDEGPSKDEAYALLIVDVSNIEDVKSITEISEKYLAAVDNEMQVSFSTYNINNFKQPIHLRDFSFPDGTLKDQPPVVYMGNKVNYQWYSVTAIPSSRFTWQNGFVRLVSADGVRIQGATMQEFSRATTIQDIFVARWIVENYPKLGGMLDSLKSNLNQANSLERERVKKFIDSQDGKALVGKIQQEVLALQAIDQQIQSATSKYDDALLNLEGNTTEAIYTSGTPQVTANQISDAMNQIIYKKAAMQKQLADSLGRDGIVSELNSSLSQFEETVGVTYDEAMSILNTKSRNSANKQAQITPLPAGS